MGSGMQRTNGQPAPVQRPHERLGTMRPREIISTLRKMGFVEQKDDRGKIVLRNSEGNSVRVPNCSYNEISGPVIRKILRNAGIDEAEFAAAGD